MYKFLQQVGDKRSHYFHMDIDIQSMIRQRRSLTGVVFLKLSAISQPIHDRTTYLHIRTAQLMLPDRNTQ